jgi:gluconolactonase
MNTFGLLLATGLTVGTPPEKPDAIIDLATQSGVELVRGEWQYSDARITETDFRRAGADGQPTGAAVRTLTFAPPDQWEKIAPDSLDKRRGNGRLSFGWYRINVTVPERAGDFATAGSTIVFETSVDDYAEVWVDGELTRHVSQNGGSVVAGWNAANRLIIARNTQPGQKIQLAVFASNGPLSNPPTNFIWMRYARLAFFAAEPGPVAITPSEVNVEVIRHDPAIDKIIGPNPKLYKLAEGFQFTEGPVWVRDRRLSAIQ